MTLVLSAAARAELSELGRTSALTPQAILERARSANSALHDLFEWNDSAAAAAYRDAQAKKVHRVYVRVLSPGERTYRTVKVSVAKVPVAVAAAPVIAAPLAPECKQELRDIASVLKTLSNSNARTKHAQVATVLRLIDSIAEKITSMVGPELPIIPPVVKIGHPAKSPAPQVREKPTAMQRRCLTCGKLFMSSHSGNRMCKGCTDTARRSGPAVE